MNSRIIYGIAEWLLWFSKPVKQKNQAERIQYVLLQEVEAVGDIDLDLAASRLGQELNLGVMVIPGDRSIEIYWPQGRRIEDVGAALLKVPELKNFGLSVNHYPRSPLWG